MPSEILKRKLRYYKAKMITHYRATNNIPATIIGAEHGNLKKVDRSGPPPEHIALNLESALVQIAPIGTKGLDNYVGCCAEVRSSNQILSIQIAPLSNIDFTDAIRPRTNQVIRRCQNCNQVFR